MTLEKYAAIKAHLIKVAGEIEAAKRPEYTIGDMDVLRNFKAVGQAAKVSPLVAAAIYARKHDDAIMHIMTAPEKRPAEPPMGRFADRLNYLALEYALLVEGGFVEDPCPMIL